MTDREYLELAAKAAGYVLDGTVLRNLKSDFEYDGWNPLTDDGDAFRLAVKLGISLSYDRLDQGVEERRVFAVYARGVEFEHLGTNPLAATRRAIVRAAAAIRARGEK